MSSLTLEEVSSQYKIKQQDLSNLQSIIQIHHDYHQHTPNTCNSLLIQPIFAPLMTVWPIVRDFSNPQRYKHFIKGCKMWGDGGAGSVRHVMVVSGLPASTSIERLETLDDENYVLSFRVIGGDHRLRNYHSYTSVHEVINQEGRVLTIVLESYTVEIPQGNTAEDAKLFADTIVRLNLQNLADISMASSSS